MDRSAIGWVHIDGRRVWWAHDCKAGLEIDLLPAAFEASVFVNGRWITPTVVCPDCDFNDYVKIIENN